MSSNTYFQAVVVACTMVMLVGVAVAPVAAVDGVDEPTTGDSLQDSSDNLSAEIVTEQVRESELDSDELRDETDVDEQVLEAYPEINQTGPEDIPAGDEDDLVNTCEYPVTPADFPLDTLPWTDDILPEDIRNQLPGSISLLKPTNSANLIFGFAPAPCDVIQPNDPQVDATDPPDDPRGQLDTARFGQYKDGFVVLLYYDATLNDSGNGPGVSGSAGSLSTTEFGDFDSELIVNDGKNEYGAKPFAEYNGEQYTYDAIFVMMGSQVGVEGECTRLEEYDGGWADLENNPLGPCEYKLVGVPNAITLKTVIGIIYDGVDWGEVLPDSVGE